MKRSGQPGSALTFTPALGKAWLTPLYDSAIGLFTREGSWRGKLVRHVNLSPGDRLIDVGSGTGSLLRDLIKSCPEADLIAVEPDPIVLAIAQRKLAATATSIRWHMAFSIRYSLVKNGGLLRSSAASCSIKYHWARSALYLSRCTSFSRQAGWC